MQFKIIPKNCFHNVPKKKEETEKQVRETIMKLQKHYRKIISVKGVNE